MGCHTWFSRELTKEEFELVREYAPTEIMELTGNTPANRENGMYDKNLYDMLMKSYTENLPCVYGCYWWELGYGASNPKLLNGEYNFVRPIEGKLYVCVDEYYDIFRLYNYPRKIIHNRRELRRWMGKKYFQLTSEQLERVSEFFKKYPSGVITFG